MNGEEKNSIEKVENLIKRCDECKLKECINCETNYTEITSIKRIVDSYKKLQKENKELNKLHIQDNKHLDFIMKHSIPVQKVKEKIKELETELKKAEKDLQEAIRLEKEAKAKEGTILWWTAQIRLDERIKTLKEILRRIKKDGDNV